MLLKKRHSSFKSLGYMLFCSLIFMLICVGQAFAGSSFTATASFYQGFDVASGMSEFDPSVLTLLFGDEGIELVLDRQDANPFDFSAAADFHFEYNDALDGSVILSTDTILGVALLSDTSFDSVTPDLLEGLDFQSDLSKIVLGSADSVLLLTADGTYIKIGNIFQQDNFGLSFEYEEDFSQNASVPEPSTLLLIGFGILSLMAIFKKARK